MGYLETVEIDDHARHRPLRLPVQWVNRPNLDFRGFAGTIASGVVHKGDQVRVLPSGRESTVTRIVTMDGDLPQAVSRPVGHADAGGRDRHQPRRPDRHDGRPSGRRRPVRDGDRVDVRRADAPGPPLLAQDRHEAGVGDDHRAQVQGERQYARAPGREEARAQRDRRLQHLARPADCVRRVHRVPRDRVVHPDRPVDQLDRRRRHDPLRAAPLAEHPLAGARREQEVARGAQGPAARGALAHRPVGRGQVARSRTWSRRSCLPSASTPTCSMATTSATA